MLIKIDLRIKDIAITPEVFFVLANLAAVCTGIDRLLELVFLSLLPV
jgi:hypothetical protein